MSILDTIEADREEYSLSLTTGVKQLPVRHFASRKLKAPRRKHSYKEHSGGPTSLEKWRPAKPAKRTKSASRGKWGIMICITSIFSRVKKTILDTLE